MSDQPADAQPPALHVSALPAVELKALVVDWGGVLTPPLDATINAWAVRDGIEYDHFRQVMRAWVGAPPDSAGTQGAAGTPDAGGPADAGGTPQSGGSPQPGEQVVADVEQAADPGPAEQSPVHLLERGEIAVSQFEDLLAAELGARGSTVPPRGLLDRMFADFKVLDQSMIRLVRRARAAGLRTALLSNSWSDDHYPEELFDGLFDAVVISGQVGMRKPEARIYRHTAALLGLEPPACAFVDDLPHNIRAAVETGMVGVLHTGYETTATTLGAIFDLPLGAEEGARGEPPA